MKKKYLAIFIILGIVFQNCTPNHRDAQTDLLTISVDDIVTVDIKLSEIVKSHEEVELDTSMEALLNYPNQIAVSEDFIVITDYMNHPAKLFRSDGRFIKNLGTIGEGPGEYHTVISPYIDDSNEEFWLMRGGNFSHPKDYWILVMDKEGNVVRQIDATPLKGNERNSNSVLINKGNLFLPGSLGSSVLMSYLAQDAKEVTRVSSKIPQDFFNYSSGSESYPRDNAYIFKVGEADTVYRFEPDTKKVSAELVLYTAKHKFDANAIRKARSISGPNRLKNIMSAAEGGYSIDLAGETSKYYIGYVTVHGSSAQKKLLFVHKKKEQANFVNLINDFSDGQIIAPETIRFYNNQYLIIHEIQEQKTDQVDVLHISKLKI